MAYKLNPGRRGDISITILVIGVFAVCVLAIVTFMVSRSGTQNNFEGPTAAENATLQLNDFYFYVDTGMSYADAAKEIGASFDQKTGKLVINAMQKDVAVQYTVMLKGRG